MSLREYTVTGPAAASGALSAAWLDIAAGGLIAMLAFPFPLVRAAFVEALPQAWLPPFIASVLAAFALGGAVYLAVTASVLGRTPGMHLLDLGFEGGRPPAGRAWAWALGWVLASGAAVVFRALADPREGAAARISGLRSGSTAPTPV